MRVLVRLVDVVNGQNRKVAIISQIAQGHSLTSLQTQLLDGLFRQIEGDGHTEEDAIGETVLLDNAIEYGKQAISSRTMSRPHDVGPVLDLPIIIGFIHETCIGAMSAFVCSNCALKSSREAELDP